ncbi:MAG: hypothetical protein IID28_01555 [Planctomycetes bacterium]|nr:hypothetical protein [Planctomycetota bacterium]
MAETSPDSIVDEIHRVREKLAEQHDFDMRAIVRSLREKQAKSGRKYETLPSKPPSFGSDSKTEGAA